MSRHFIQAAYVAAFLAAFAPAALADETITLRLDPAKLAETIRLIDLQPMEKAPPKAFWDLQNQISAALEANSDALRAVVAARGAAR